MNILVFIFIKYMIYNITFIIIYYILLNISNVFYIIIYLVGNGFSETKDHC